MKNRHVLLIDKNPNTFGNIQVAPTDDLNFHFANSINSANEALSRKQYAVGLIVLDSFISENLEAVESLIAAHSRTEWIALASPALLEIPTVRSVIARAFYDYHTLPIDRQRLLMTIGHACGLADFRFVLHQKPGDEPGYHGILGNSPAMKAFFQQLEKVVDADLPVLIGGETGTGKELIAQAIHAHSRRAHAPFVALNCGAVPQNLIQSELFGHERGAFTGAAQRKIGNIEAADGGILFLDEIGDLPLCLQPNLLRVLQERTITRIGSTQSIPVDFRIISATHVDLQKAIDNGSFREDLYYRLGVVHLSLPPLRARDGDITLLANAIFNRLSASHPQCRANGFTSQALRVMNHYDWPGNVRELINRITRAVILCDGKLIGPGDLGLNGEGNAQAAGTLEEARASFDRNILEISLRNNGNNVSRAARQLGVSRVTFYRMMNKHNIGAPH